MVPLLHNFGKDCWFIYSKVFGEKPFTRHSHEAERCAKSYICAFKEFRRCCGSFLCADKCMATHLVFDD